MKNLFIFIFLLALNTFVFAETDLIKKECTYSQEGKITVGWKAYKTPAKLGVGGIFDDVTYSTNTKEAKSLKELLVGSSVIIKTSSVNSKNEGRDLKLVNSFFKIMSDEIITSKIVDITDKNIITIEISMNGMTKKVPMSYTYNESLLNAAGVIDLFDFQASKALSSINKACFDLHSGKTWNDVAISFEMNIGCDTKVKK